MMKVKIVDVTDAELTKEMEAVRLRIAERIADEIDAHILKTLYIETHYLSMDKA